MKTVENITQQRDWFMLMAEALQVEADLTQDVEKRVLSENFAIITGALDWVLADEVAE